MKRKDEGKGDKALGSGKDKGKGDKALGDMVLDSMKRSRLDTGSDPEASCSFRRYVPRAAPTDQDDGRQGRHGDDHASCAQRSSARRSCGSNTLNTICPPDLSSDLSFLNSQD